MQLWLTERGRLLPVKAHEHGLPLAETVRHGVREVVVEPGPPHGREVEVPRLVPAAGPCEGLLDQLQPRAQHLLPEVRLDLLHRLLARDELRGGDGNRRRAGAGAVLAAARVRVRKRRGRLGQRSARHPVVLVVRRRRRLPRRVRLQTMICSAARVMQCCSSEVRRHPL